MQMAHDGQEGHLSSALRRVDLMVGLFYNWLNVSPSDNSRFMKLANFKYTPFKKSLRNSIEYFSANYDDSTKIKLV